MNQTNTLTQKDGPAETLRSSGWFASLFKRKPKPEPKEQEKPWWEPEWEAIQAAYPVGRSFEYLGREMIVTRLRWYSPGLGFCGCGIYIPPTLPAVITEYADERGEIHEHAFEMSAWPILANTRDDRRRATDSAQTNGA